MGVFKGDDGSGAIKRGSLIAAGLIGGGLVPENVGITAAVDKDQGAVSSAAPDEASVQSSTRDQERVWCFKLLTSKRLVGTCPHKLLSTLWTNETCAPSLPDIVARTQKFSWLSRSLVANQLHILHRNIYLVLPDKDAMEEWMSDIQWVIYQRDNDGEYQRRPSSVSVHSAVSFSDTISSSPKEKF